MRPREAVRFATQFFRGNCITAAEVGVLKGKHAVTILAHLKVKTLYLIDPYINYSEYPERRNYARIERYARKVIKPYEDKVVWIRDFSENALGEILDGSLDFVYIDGNHQTDYVKKDMEGFWTKLTSGGILAGHDINNSNVEKAVHEFLEELHDVDFYRGGNDWWIVRKQKPNQIVCNRTKGCFYTAIVGDRDRVRGDILTFTDEVVPNDPIRSSRYYKCLPHRCLPNHNFSVWVDGNIHITKLLGECLDDFEKLLRNYDVVFFKTPSRRKNIRGELGRLTKKINQGRKDIEDLQRITNQVAMYEKEGIGLNGLWAGTFLIRRNNPRVKVLGEIWWNEIQYGSVRDQLSLPYAVERSGVKIKELTWADKGRWFRIRAHRKRGSKVIIPPKAPREIYFPKYDRMGDYHWRQYSKGNYYKTHVDVLLEWVNERGPKVLDVGCGDGLITSKLSAQGIDVNERGVAECINHGVDARVCSVYDVTGNYDAVVIADVLEHLQYPEKALVKLREVTDLLYVALPFKTRNKSVHHFREYNAIEILRLAYVTGWELLDMRRSNLSILAKFRKCEIPNVS